VALLKIWRTVRQRGPLGACKKLLTVAPAYLRGIKCWRVGRCQCCERLTIFLGQHNNSAELRSCLHCSANERYELLAAEIRKRYGDRLSEMDVLELDPHSPLRKVLSRAQSYTRSFYEEGCPTISRDGAVCEDITALNFGKNSFDLIVSSEVLEHVACLERALSESARVLRPGIKIRSLVVQILE